MNWKIVSALLGVILLGNGTMGFAPTPEAATSKATQVLPALHSPFELQIWISDGWQLVAQ